MQPMMFKSVVLPLPDGPDDGDEICFLDGEVDAAHGVYRGRAQGVILLHALQFDYVHGKSSLTRQGFRRLADFTFLLKDR